MAFGNVRVWAKRSISGYQHHFKLVPLLYSFSPEQRTDRMSSDKLVEHDNDSIGIGLD